MKEPHDHQPFQEPKSFIWLVPGFIVDGHHAVLLIKMVPEV
jgi:hypothetical protein